MGIHINHLSFFVVGGGHIFVGDIAVLGEGVKHRIEVLCSREKIASAGVIEVGFQSLFDILGLDDLNDLLSLDNVPVRSVHAKTINRLITVVVSNIESPQQCVMIYTFIGRLNTTGTAVGTMKNTGYPKYQPVKLTAPVLTAKTWIPLISFSIYLLQYSIYSSEA